MSLAELRVEGDKWLGAAIAGELEKRWTEIKADDSFTFVYTSGTTGPPKGVVLTHKNIVWECDSMHDVLPVDEHDEQLLFLPMAHIFAKILEWTTIAKGSRIAFAESIAKIKDNLARGAADLHVRRAARAREGLSRHPRQPQRLARRPSRRSSIGHSRVGKAGIQVQAAPPAGSARR